MMVPILLRPFRVRFIFLGSYFNGPPGICRRCPAWRAYLGIHTHYLINSATIYLPNGRIFGLLVCLLVCLFSCGGGETLLGHLL